ncbi:MAG: hypothetical protein Q8W44_07385 [Candidatus Palauibacterales bacterium]|nr:hypothetical protein [Candidatus Palauibacterales bacterium]
MRRGALRAALLAAIALVVATAGCRKDVTGLDSDNSALVYGTVSDAGGQPVDSATVRTTAYSNLCGSRVAVQSETLTDSEGRYSDTLLFFRTRLRGCLAVEAVPAARDDLSTTRVEISTRSIWSPGVDSVQLDLTLDSLP